MATKKKNNKPVESTNPAETKKERTLSREELMKTPGWSNVAPGSPQAKKAERTE